MKTATNDQKAFVLALHLADQISRLDLDSVTKERVAMTNLIRDAIESRDAALAARVLELEAALREIKSSVIEDMPPQQVLAARTEAAIMRAGMLSLHGQQQNYLADFARTLTSELAQARAELEKWKDRVTDIRTATEATVEGLRAELAAARERIAAMKGGTT